MPKGLEKYRLKTIRSRSLVRAHRDQSRLDFCWCFDWLHFAKANQPDAGLRCCSIIVQHTVALFSCRIFISNLSQDLLQLYIQARASGQNEPCSASFIEVG